MDFILVLVELFMQQLNWIVGVGGTIFPEQALDVRGSVKLIMIYLTLQIHLVLMVLI